MVPLVQYSKEISISILGADKFAETFLGEFDTPEAIWGNDMRLVIPCRLATYFFVSCIMWLIPSSHFVTGLKVVSNPGPFEQG